MNATSIIGASNLFQTLLQKRFRSGTVSRMRTAQSGKINYMLIEVKLTGPRLPDFCRYSQALSAIVKDVSTTYGFEIQVTTEIDKSVSYTGSELEKKRLEGPFVQQKLNKLDPHLILGLAIAAFEYEMQHCFGYSIDLRTDNKGPFHHVSEIGNLVVEKIDATLDDDEIQRAVEFFKNRVHCDYNVQLPTVIKKRPVATAESICTKNMVDSACKDLRNSIEVKFPEATTVTTGQVARGTSTKGLALAKVVVRYGMIPDRDSYDEYLKLLQLFMLRSYNVDFQIRTVDEEDDSSDSEAEPPVETDDSNIVLFVSDGKGYSKPPKEMVTTKLRATADEEVDFDKFDGYPSGWATEEKMNIEATSIGEYRATQVNKSGRKERRRIIFDYRRYRWLPMDINMTGTVDWNHASEESMFQKWINNHQGSLEMEVSRLTKIRQQQQPEAVSYRYELSPSTSSIGQHTANQLHDGTVKRVPVTFDIAHGCWLPTDPVTFKPVAWDNVQQFQEFFAYIQKERRALDSMRNYATRIMEDDKRNIPLFNIDERATDPRSMSIPNGGERDWICTLRQKCNKIKYTSSEQDGPEPTDRATAEPMFPYRNRWSRTSPFRGSRSPPATAAEISSLLDNEIRDTISKCSTAEEKMRNNKLYKRARTEHTHSSAATSLAGTPPASARKGRTAALTGDAVQLAAQARYRSGRYTTTEDEEDSHEEESSED